MARCTVTFANIFYPNDPLRVENAAALARVPLEASPSEPIYTAEFYHYVIDQKAVVSFNILEPPDGHLDDDAAAADDDDDDDKYDDDDEDDDGDTDGDDFCNFAYPTYKDARELLADCQSPSGLILPQYTKLVHEKMKECFETKMALMVVAAAGEALGQDGGIGTMVVGYYSLHHLMLRSPLGYSSVRVHKRAKFQSQMASVKRQLSQIWDGIHGWAH